MFERDADRAAFRIHTAQEHDAFFGLLKLRVTPLQQTDPQLIARQRFLQTDLAIFQFADDQLELREGLFEGQVVGQGITHACIPRADHRPWRL